MQVNFSLSNTKSYYNINNQNVSPAVQYRSNFAGIKKTNDGDSFTKNMSAPEQKVNKNKLFEKMAEMYENFVQSRMEKEPQNIEVINMNEVIKSQQTEKNSNEKKDLNSQQAISKEELLKENAKMYENFVQSRMEKEPQNIEVINMNEVIKSQQKQ